MIHIIRLLEKTRDSRVIKWEAFLSKYYKDFGNIKIVTWENKINRNKEKGIDKIKVGRKELPLFITYPLIIIYLFLYSMFKIKKGDLVIAMDLDVFLPIYFGSFWKKTNIYFDIVDPIAETRFRKIPFNKIFDFIEWLILRFREKNILPAEYRKYYYLEKLKLNVSKLNYIVFENIPTYEKDVEILTISIKWPKEDSFFIIGYFGILEKERGLIELIEFTKKYNNIKLIIAGKGSLTNYIKQVSDYKKISFLGEYHPSKLIDLYSEIDFTWAYYSSFDNLIHYKYACPNKYYEHLCFKKPIIINKYLFLSKKIKEMKTGIVIDDALNEVTFMDLYTKINNYEYDIKNFSKWDKYSNYKINLLS